VLVAREGDRFDVVGAERETQSKTLQEWGVMPGDTILYKYRDGLRREVVAEVNYRTGKIAIERFSPEEKRRVLDDKDKMELLHQLSGRGRGPGRGKSLVRWLPATGIQEIVQKGRRASAERVVQAYSFSKVSWGAIPPEVKDFADTIRETLISAGVRGNVKPFHSGYIGIVIDIPQGKYLYLDQPGVMGLEDQSPGYISFGKYPEGRELVYVKHDDRRFGDIDLSRAERREAQNDVLIALEEILGED
jgi:hypothetical protein